jgi:tetratricopeptide (TPR) repeat protein
LLKSRDTVHFRTTNFVLVVMLSALSAAPGRAQSTPAQLARTGWDALREGDGNRAAAAFGEALTLSPRDPVLNVGAGAAAHLLGREADATKFLQRAVELNPRLLHAWVLLGEIAYREGDLDLAVKSYERAIALSPTDLQIAARLAEWKKEAALHHAFEERRDDRFTVMFEGQAEERLAARATSVLDSAFQRIGRTLGQYPPDSITVILYTQQQFRDVTRAPDWSDGLFDGARIRMPVRGALQDLARFDHVLTHELTHAVVHSLAARGVPVWLHEGLARYFEPEDAAAAERRLRAARVVIPLADLEGSFTGLNAQEAIFAYDESLVAVRLLIERIGTGIGLLLQDLGEGQRIDEAIQRFGFTLDDLQHDLDHRLQPASR